MDRTTVNGLNKSGAEILWRFRWRARPRRQTHLQVFCESIGTQSNRTRGAFPGKYEKMIHLARCITLRSLPDAGNRGTGVRALDGYTGRSDRQTPSEVGIWSMMHHIRNLENLRRDGESVRWSSLSEPSGERRYGHRFRGATYTRH